MSAALWFFDQGVGVFPIVTPGKAPACRSWDDHTCTREQAARFKNYGVRLGSCRQGWLGVVDTDDAVSTGWASEFLPPTPLTVRTSRGRHHYYRLTGPVPKFIHRDGLVIEFRNAGQYVVGPGSRHTRAHVYTASAWSGEWTDLPVFPSDFTFDDGSVRGSRAAAPGEPFELPDAVYAGERHDQLFKLIRSLKALGNERETVRWAVTQANENRCQPPLAEDRAFESWFSRAWTNPDRPLARTADPFAEGIWAQL